MSDRFFERQCVHPDLLSYTWISRQTRTCRRVKSIMHTFIFRFITKLFGLNIIHGYRLFPITRPIVLVYHRGIILYGR